MPGLGATCLSGARKSAVRKVCFTHHELLYQMLVELSCDVSSSRSASSDTSLLEILSVVQSMSSSLVENLGLEAKRHLAEAVAERVKTIEEGRNRFSRNYRQSSRQYATPLNPPVSASKYARAQAAA